MDRRNVFASAFAALAGAVAARTSSPARAEDPPASAGVPKVVYHLSDMEKVGFVMGNIRNHLSGMGGGDKVRIGLVVHGSPLKAFRADTANMAIKSDLAGFRDAGVQFYACIHTMEAMKLALGDLLPGFAVAEKGGVVKLAELQGLGWAYLRP